MKTLYFADAAYAGHRIPQSQWTRKQRRAFKQREAANEKKSGYNSSYRGKKSYGYTTAWIYNDIGGAGYFFRVIDMWLHVTSPK